MAYRSTHILSMCLSRNYKSYILYININKCSNNERAYWTLSVHTSFTGSHDLHRLDGPLATARPWPLAPPPLPLGGPSVAAVCRSSLNTLSWARLSLSISSRRRLHSAGHARTHANPSGKKADNKQLRTPSKKLERAQQAIDGAKGDTHR